MKIKQIKKVKSKYEVIIEEEVFLVEPQTLIYFNLHKNKEITKARLIEIINFDEKQVIFNKAIKYLKTQKTTLDFKKYLFSLNVEARYIYQLVDEFTKKGYLNDDLFVVNYLNKYEKKYALKRIEEQLLNKGINKDLIDKHISKKDNTFFEEHLKNIISKTKKGNLYQTKQAVLRKMVSLGYDLKETEKRLNNLNIKVDEDEALLKELNKLKTKYTNKYDPKEVNFKIKQALYRKGFNKEIIDKYLMEDSNDF